MAKKYVLDKWRGREKLQLYNFYGVSSSSSSVATVLKLAMFTDTTHGSRITTRVELDASNGRSPHG